MNQNFRTQQGVIAVVFAISILVLFAAVGLVIDTARYFLVKSEMQNAVDACALSGVIELNGLPDALTRATAVGVYMVNQRHLINFQSSPAEISSSEVKFSSTLNSDVSFVNAGSIAPSSVKYMRCESNLSHFPNFFMSLLKLTGTDVHVTATATAVPSISTCALPMGILSKNDSAKDFGYSKYDSVQATGGSSTSNGWFTWADVAGSLGTTSLGPYSQAIQQYGGCQALTVPGRCIQTKSGLIASMQDSWNSRFGLFRTAGTVNLTNATPDLSGYGYSGARVPTGSINDYIANHVSNRDPFQGSIGSYSTPANALKNYGASGRRLGVVSVISSTNTCTGGSKLVGWACVFLSTPNGTANNSSQSKDFIFEYESNASDPTSLCKVFGIPGGPNNNGPLVPTLVQ